MRITVYPDDKQHDRWFIAKLYTNEIGSPMLDRRRIGAQSATGALANAPSGFLPAVLGEPAVSASRLVAGAQVLTFEIEEAPMIPT